MRKESLKIANAFANGTPAAAARTNTDGQTIWLHGNRIAQREQDGSVWVTLAGWGTVTTRERLNTLLLATDFDARLEEMVAKVIRHIIPLARPHLWLQQF